jgi:hypothetical protein
LVIAHKSFDLPCDPIARKTLPRPPHPHPASVTIAIRPSGGVGWREFVEMICPTGEVKYFCKGDSTGFSTARPSGKSHPMNWRRSLSESMRVVPSLKLMLQITAGLCSVYKRDENYKTCA